MIDLSAQKLASEPEFKLKGIVPWGRRLDEYQAFFNLRHIEPGIRILDVGSGPSSFACEASQCGIAVSAIDPLYALDAGTIRKRFDETVRVMRAGLRTASYRFNWSFYGSEEQVYRRRFEALSLFLEDYQSGVGDRYITGQLPFLPFADRSYDIALSSHLLFLYGDELNRDFHIAALREMLRVAGEVRVFPLVNLDGRPSSHLPEVMRVLEADGFIPQLVHVDFEFQMGATKMLRISR